MKQLLAAFVLALPITVAAQNFSLVPGASIAVSLDRIRLVQPGTPPLAYRNVGAVARIALDPAGTILTINLQNASAADTGAALYALDLGLGRQIRLEAPPELVAGNFPSGGIWIGPTDTQSVTEGTGEFTFAARDAVLAPFGAFLEDLAPLPPGFFGSGQGGEFAMRILLADARDLPLKLRPVAYFVAPDAFSTAPRRVRLAAFASGVGPNR